jgi:hypothetical protein
MKCHVELSVFLSTTEEVTKGDLDRVVHTISTYLSSCGGVPHVECIIPEIEGDALCVTAYATAGIPRGTLQDASYIRRQVTAGLQKSGMEIT